MPPDQSPRLVLPRASYKARRRVRAGLACLAAMAGLGLFLFLPDALTNFDVASGVELLLCEAAPVGLWLLLRRSFFRWYSPREGPVSVTAEGLHVDGELVIPRGEIARVFAHEQDGRSALFVHPRGRFAPAEIDGVTRDEAEQVIERLGLRAGRSAVEHWLSPRASGRLAALVALLLTMAATGAAAFGAFPAPGWLVFAGLLLELALTFLLALDLIASRVRVAAGLDGVLIERRLGTRFLPHSSIGSVSYQGGALCLSLASGEVVEIGVGGLMKLFVGTGALSPSDYGELVAREIRACCEAARQRPESAPAVLLHPRAASPAAGVKRLRAALAGEAAYRGPVPAAEQLWAAVENALGPAEHRALAAAALTPELDEAGRARLRVAAHATVSPSLRSAFEAAADEDDERLFEALEARPLTRPAPPDRSPPPWPPRR